MKNTWQTLSHPSKMFAIFAISFLLVLMLILLVAYAHSNFEATTLSTLWAAIIAGAAAIGASQLTGQQFQKVERIKFDREVAALKRGIVIELCWATENILLKAIPSAYETSPVNFHCTIPTTSLPLGLKIFHRGADRLAITGDDFTNRVVSCYGVLHSGTALQKNGVDNTTYNDVHFCALLERLWRLSESDDLPDGTKALLDKNVFYVTEKWFSSVLRHHGSFDNQLDTNNGLKSLVQTVKRICPDVISAAERKAGLSTSLHISE